MGGQTEATVRAAYDTGATDYARAMPDTGPEHTLDLAVLDTFVVRVDGHPILDAGCGAGRSAATSPTAVAAWWASTSLPR